MEWMQSHIMRNYESLAFSNSSRSKHLHTPPLEELSSNSSISNPFCHPLDTLIITKDQHRQIDPFNDYLRSILHRMIHFAEHNDQIYRRGNRHHTHYPRVHPPSRHQALHSSYDEVM